MNRENIEAMLQLPDIRQTRVYQEAKEEGRKEGIRQFIDEKSYKPGLGAYDRARAFVRGQARSSPGTSSITTAGTRRTAATAR